VRATDGDTRLGGEDIDARLVDHFLEVFKKQTGLIPPPPFFPVSGSFQKTDWLSSCLSVCAFRVCICVCMCVSTVCRRAKESVLGV
jgi:hypothetical protein